MRRNRAAATFALLAALAPNLPAWAGPSPPPIKRTKERANGRYSCSSREIGGMHLEVARAGDSGSKG